MDLNNYYSFVCEQQDDGSVRYYFDTDFSIIYSVYFDPPDFSEYMRNLPHLSRYGCLFGFCPVEDDAPRKADPQVAHTISRIVEDYFESFGQERVLLFHCDNDDARPNKKPCK